VYQMTAGPGPRQAGPAPAPRHAPPGEVVLVGAHGGAGVTTLAGLLRPAWDMGVARRPGPGRRPLRPTGRPVVLAARNTAAAAARAVTATGLLAEQGVQVTVLAVISDGLPSPPRPGTCSGSWTAGSARSSGSRSSPPSASPPTRWRHPAAPGTAGARRDPRARRQAGTRPGIRNQTVRRSRWDSSFTP